MKRLLIIILALLYCDIAIGQIELVDSVQQKTVLRHWHDGIRYVKKIDSSYNVKERNDKDSIEISFDSTGYYSHNDTLFAYQVSRYPSGGSATRLTLFNKLGHPIKSYGSGWVDTSYFTDSGILLRR
ncbi:MAG TPA: hypothetical protein VFO76_13565, partial [Candidatus Kapabacteria bacterium]|nr:hypothetical protein [Candidatus Kapabacteria bacterium]